MENIVILSANRTPIGKFGKALSGFKSTQLGSMVVAEAVKRAQLKPTDIEYCYMGNVLSAGLGQNPSRQAAVNAGLPVEIGATTVNTVCGSGMKAVCLAAEGIKAGDYSCVMAGGMESMSNAPYLLPGARFGFRMNNQTTVDSMVFDGLWDIFNNKHMGFTGEIVAERYNVTREDADKLSLDSHIKAANATKSGMYKNEILPIKIKTKKEEIIFDKDEGIREDTSMEALAKLKPMFKEDGIVTAGNSSQVSDGASALVITSESFAKEHGIKPLARIVAYGEKGVLPEHIMEAPIPASRYVLEKAKMKIDDIDLFEHNEAFATASCAVRKELKVPDEIFNINGGAVALGHPIGCSGARVLTTLVYALIHKKKDTGLATLCYGGGNAISMIVERC